MKVARQAIALLTIAGVALGVGARLWANAAALAEVGPSHVRVSPDGHLAVLFRDRILMFDPSGNDLDPIDLAAADKTISGNFDFFANGDLLFYHAAKAPTFLESLFTFFRQQDRGGSATAGTNGLVRCEVSPLRCRKFTAELPSTRGRAFGIAIDREHGEAYISAAAKFELFKFAASGDLLARSAEGLKFPNGLLLHGPRLYIADTNNHRIKVIARPNRAGVRSPFGAELASIPVALPDSASRWPTQLDYGGGAWWVVINDAALTKGQVVRFDEDWKGRDILVLPVGSDPIGVAYFQGKLIVTDYKQFELYRFDPDGVQVASFRSPELRRVFENAKERRQWLSFLVDAALYLVLAILVAGFGTIYILDRRSTPS